MQLELLIERNWCNVAYREIRFMPGMNALLGPNGSGKSNTLNAIVFALTGDYSRNAGTKAENIYHLAQDSPASVRLVFTHKNTRFDVTRGLRDVTSTLQVTDLQGTLVEPASRGENKVTKRLNELLFVNSEILSGYVFVGQGKMFEPFDTTIKPADRLVAFQQLFGLDRLEMLWEALGEALVGLPVIQAPDPESFRAELVTIQGQAAVAEAAYNALLHMANWRLEEDQDYLLIQRARQIAGMVGTLTQRRSTRRSAIQLWWANRKELMETRSQRDMMACGMAAISSESQRIEMILTAARMRVEAQQTHQRLQTELEVAQRALTQHQATAPTPRPTGAPTVAHLQEQINTLNTQLAVDRELLLRMGDGSVCPTCGRPITEANVADRLQTEQRIEANTITLQPLQRELAAAQTHATAMQRYTTELERLNARSVLVRQQHAESETRLTNLSMVSEGDITWAQSQKDAMATIQRGIDQMDGKLGPLVSNNVTQRNLIRAAKKSIRDLEVQVANAPTPEMVTLSEQNLNTKSARSHEFAIAQATHTSQQQRLQQATEQLAKIEELGRMAAQGQMLRTKLQTLRDILHRDNLPKALLQQRLTGIGHATNEALELFGAPFRLQPREDKLSYRAIFTDGVEQPIERLSGGQKVIMALAFRIAVNARFASELGLLCLDEPTVYLDADNVRCLEPALVRLRQHAQATGLQCVLITHEDVGNLFDHVITCP